MSTPEQRAEWRERKRREREAIRAEHTSELIAERRRESDKRYRETHREQRREQQRRAYKAQAQQKWEES
jgi:hypothetical protein